MILMLKCEKCEETIAQFETTELYLPLKGGMFKPKGGGYAQPFPEEVTWELIFCPYCTYHPYSVTEQIAQAWCDGTGQGPVNLYTEKGFFNVETRMLTLRDGHEMYIGATKKEEKTLDLPEEVVPMFRCERCNKPFHSQNALNSHTKIHRHKGKSGDLLGLQP
jgi:hypothetical protein